MLYKLYQNKKQDSGNDWANLVLKDSVNFISKTATLHRLLMTIEVAKGITLR